MSIRPYASAALCVVAVLAAACGGSNQPANTGTPAEQKASAPAEPPPPLPGDSVITGRVALKGTAPAERILKMSAADPLCMGEGGSTKSEVIVVGPDNALQNVFLYVKDGLGDRTFVAPKTPVVLDQSGCRYLPHVFGAQVGQPVEELVGAGRGDGVDGALGTSPLPHGLDRGDVAPTLQALDHPVERAVVELDALVLVPGAQRLGDLVGVHGPLVQAAQHRQGEGVASCAPCHSVSDTRNRAFRQGRRVSLPSRPPPVASVAPGWGTPAGPHPAMSYAALAAFTVERKPR